MNVAISLPNHIVGWVDRQLNDETTWSSYLKVPDRSSQASFSGKETNNAQMTAASQMDSSSKTACKVPTLAFLASRVTIAHLDRYRNELLVEDVQSTLLQHTKKPSDYRELMGSGLIEDEVLKDFYRLKLAEREIEGSLSKFKVDLDEAQLEKYNLDLLKNGQGPFLGIFFQNHLRSLSVEEKRQWIFRSRHPQVAPLIFLVFRICQAVKQAWIKVVQTLGNKLSFLSFRARRMLAVAVLLSVAYALYCVGFYFQKSLWSPFSPFFVRKLAAYQTSATVQMIVKLAAVIFNHQYWLALTVLLASNSLAIVSNPILKHAINRISTLCLAIVLLPSAILIPPFLAGAALIYFVVKSFLFSSGYRSFSRQVRFKAHQWIWPLLNPSSSSLSRSEKDYIYRVSAKWIASFQLPELSNKKAKNLTDPSAKPVESSKEKVDALPEPCAQPVAASAASSTVFP